MDIDEFIQQDVLVFLDQKLEQPQKRRVMDDDMYVSRDFEEDLLNALDSSNIMGAKRVLHDLKQKFDEIPNGTPEKDQMKYLLQSLYEKFREHVEATSTISDMDDTLTRISRGKSPVPQQDDQKKTRLVAHASGLLDQVEKLLSGGNVREAMVQYRSARNDLLNMEHSVPGELAHRFTMMHDRIRLASQKKVPEKKVIEQQPRTDLDTNLILQLEREKRSLEKQLHDHDLRGAMQTYKRMRVIAQQLSHPKHAEDVAQKLMKIYAIITAFTKKHVIP